MFRWLFERGQKKYFISLENEGENPEYFSNILLPETPQLHSHVNFYSETGRRVSVIITKVVYGHFLAGKGGVALVAKSAKAQLKLAKSA